METVYAQRRTTFLFVHNMGEYLLKAIISKYLADGLVPRIHGHTGRIPHNSLVYKDLECIISFVIQFCEMNAILMPGRVPGYKRDDIQILLPPPRDLCREHTVTPLLLSQNGL